MTRIEMTNYLMEQWGFAEFVLAAKSDENLLSLYNKCALKE